MQPWIVWTTTLVTDEVLRQFAERAGGYWNDSIGGEAVIRRGGVSAFIAAALANDVTNVMPEDVERATLRMGKEPTSMVSITFGSGEESGREALRAFDLRQSVERPAERHGCDRDRHVPGK